MEAPCSAPTRPSCVVDVEFLLHTVGGATGPTGSNAPRFRKRLHSSFREFLVGWSAHAWNLRRSATRRASTRSVLHRFRHRERRRSRSGRCRRFESVEASNNANRWRSKSVDAPDNANRWRSKSVEAPDNANRWRSKSVEAPDNANRWRSKSVDAPSCLEGPRSSAFTGRKTGDALVATSPRSLLARVRRWPVKGNDGISSTRIERRPPGTSRDQAGPPRPIVSTPRAGRG